MKIINKLILTSMLSVGLFTQCFSYEVNIDVNPAVRGVVMFRTVHGDGSPVRSEGWNSVSSEQGTWSHVGVTLGDNRRLDVRFGTVVLRLNRDVSIMVNADPEGNPIFEIM